MIITIIKVKVILKRMKYRGVFRTQSNITMLNGFWLFTIFPKKLHRRCSKYVWVLNTPLKSKLNNKLFSSSRSLVSLTNSMFSVIFNKLYVFSNFQQMVCFQ